MSSLKQGQSRGGGEKGGVYVLHPSTRKRLMELSIPSPSTHMRHGIGFCSRRI